MVIIGIVLEDLNIKNMMKNCYLAKSISDVSWSEFRRQLEYKAKWNFKHFIIIDRFDPTSKTCSNCGCIQDMSLNKRQYNCPDCGISIDRDLNASINIRNLGLNKINTEGRSGINACGVETVVSTVKQEKECLVN
ncbi:MAG: RNA-guided endonuclease TnpB family protein [Candidatus Humimicrobiia bacterium]